MGIARDEFYNKLKENYKDCNFGSDSVIYQYISEGHERLVQQAIKNSTSTTDSVKKSNILQIKYHWELLKSGKESPEQYINHLLHILKKRPVLYQDTTITTSVDFLIDFISVGLALDSTTQNKLRQNNVKKKTQDKLIELVELLNSKDKTIQNNIWMRFQQSEYTIKPYTKLCNITKIIIQRATSVEIKAFFYDAGYSLTDSQPRTSDDTTNKTPVKKPSSSERTTRKKIDKTLSLMDLYCEQKKCSLFSSISYPSESDCEKLFSLLVHGENQDVLIPLRVDSKTGCALYIIGKKYYECLYFGKTDLISTKFKHSPNSCFYAILEFHNPFYDILKSKQIIPNDYLDHSVGYMLKNDFNAFTSFHDAETEFKEYCIEHLTELKEKINLKLPDGCPSFFYQYSTANQVFITEDDLNEIKKELLEEFEDYKNNNDMDNIYVGYRTIRKFY